MSLDYWMQSSRCLPMYEIKDCAWATYSSLQSPQINVESSAINIQNEYILFVFQKKEIDYSRYLQDIVLYEALQHHGFPWGSKKRARDTLQHFLKKGEINKDMVFLIVILFYFYFNSITKYSQANNLLIKACISLGIGIFTLLKLKKQTSSIAQFFSEILKHEKKKCEIVFPCDYCKKCNQVKRVNCLVNGQ